MLSTPLPLLGESLQCCSTVLDINRQQLANAGGIADAWLNAVETQLNWFSFDCLLCTARRPNMQQRTEHVT